ncbi:hypothetical protein SAMN02745220_00493 [Desulfopila aestuarii DSM 18488]|uniref:Uncharacterized protein n=1 Tax=Desulfopila aestuarii DSM 18488 TaxID=1121416 RepID=A0A1M7XY63_9BACT|nr:hypothetical protein SAMN02745220_00493 [Desulfopila aestuarii DSM 18488]
MLGHLLSVFGKGRSFAGRQVVHPDPVALNADLFQKIVDVGDPFTAAEIPLIIMTVAFKTADAENTVGTFLKTSEQVHHIYFAGTRDAEYFYIGGVGQSHRTCQVRS